MQYNYTFSKRGVKRLNIQQEFKKTDICIIPKGWDVLKLEELFSLEYGKGLTENKREKGEFPVFGSNGIVGYHSQYIVKGPGITIGRKGTIGAITWSYKNFWPIDTTYYVLLKKSETDLKWLYYKLLSLKLVKLNMATGTPGLNRDLVYKLKILLPPLPEQKKIAEILSTVDNAIEKVDEAIAKTERLKKGLMQELLTKGIGHKEFKDTEIGRIPKEWEVVEIKHVGKVLTGKTPPSTKEIYWNGNIPFITPEDLKGEKYIIKTNRYITLEGKKHSAEILPPYTVLVVCIGSTIGKVALAKTDSVTNQQINSVICKDDVNPEYIYYSILLRSFVLRYFSGVAAVPIIKKSLFEKVKIPLPKEINEQKKIAEILSTADKRIELLKKKKEILNRIKKGLMNDLLTGIRRVKL